MYTFATCVPNQPRGNSKGCAGVSWLVLCHSTANANSKYAIFGLGEKLFMFSLQTLHVGGDDELVSLCWQMI